MSGFRCLVHRWHGLGVTVLEGRECRARQCERCDEVQARPVETPPGWQVGKMWETVRLPE